jgi:hypothetical protein
MASRYTTPEALARHRAQSRAWVQQALARGCCVICGDPHERRNRRTGQRARRCELCAAANNEYQRRRYRQKCEARA